MRHKCSASSLSQDIGVPRGFTDISSKPRTGPLVGSQRQPFDKRL